MLPEFEGCARLVFWITAMDTFARCRLRARLRRTLPHGVGSVGNESDCGRCIVGNTLLI